MLSSSQTLMRKITSTFLSLSKIRPAKSTRSVNQHSAAHGASEKSKTSLSLHSTHAESLIKLLCFDDSSNFGACSTMEIELAREFDVEETIFVAVGKNVEKSKTLLFWAIESFSGKRICVLHVHRPAIVVSLADKKSHVNELRQDEASQNRERKRIHDLLNQYQFILAQEGVQYDKVWIERDSIEKGIVEMIARYDIRWLVMGAAADKNYTKKLAQLKSKKSMFVCQHAPNYCHIWFSCKGRLIFTREGRCDPKAEITLPLMPLDVHMEIEQPELLRLESVVQMDKSEELFRCREDADELDRISERYNRFEVTSGESTTGHSTSETILLLTNEEEKAPGGATEKNCYRLEKAIMDAEDSKQKALGEALKRWKEEDDALEAKCKAKALERLCIKEMSLTKEMEEALAREREKVERIRKQRDEFMKELQSVQECKSIRENQLAESKDTVKELEEKIISAVELLISFKERRDAAWIECENARREVKKLTNLAKVGAGNFCWSKILEFSFMEINEATHNFEPSWKIGEGRFGSVYKGILRNVYVAIKMLPSYGSKHQLDFFQHGVEILSRVRHPNLVTLIGTCPESRSLVYEYVENGSLEDRLTCKDKTPRLLWKTRTQIAVQICSALIFLHSNIPCIIHGNLKPSNVLLDANFVVKLGGFGIFHLISQSQNEEDVNWRHDKHNSNYSAEYVDPEYIETGRFTPESDVYSFGLVLLRLLTGRPVVGTVKHVKCALENDNLVTVLDYSAGDWSLEQAKQLARLALKCCEKNRLNRHDLLSEIWSVLEPMRSSVDDLTLCLDLKAAQRIPSHFVCPIFQEVMKDPQIAADGFTYEADAIKGWLKSGHNTSPMTNLKLPHCNLLPNHALHQAILEWRQF